jgi:hypothetical protein
MPDRPTPTIPTYPKTVVDERWTRLWAKLLAPLEDEQPEDGEPDDGPEAA